MMNSFIYFIILTSIALANCVDDGWPIASIGDVIELSCNKTGSNKITRKCTADGWNKPDFSPCLSTVSCDQNLNNQLLTLTSSPSICPSQIITFPLKCINGSWVVSSSTFKCKASFCQAETSHGIYFPETLETRNITVQCTIGYNGFILRQCYEGGQWSHIENHCYSIPYCKADEYHNISWPDTDINYTHTYDCPEGEKGSITRKCNAYGIWEVVQNKCVKEIGLCETKTIGKYTFPQTTSFQNSTVSCIPKVYGIVTVYCNNGTFSDIYDTCHSDPLDCQPTVESSVEWPETPCRTTANVTCPSGKTGYLLRLCSVTGAWQSIRDNCKTLVQCPSETHNGILWPITEHNQTVVRPCPFGFPAITSRRCDENGIWDENDDTCLDLIPSCPKDLYSGYTWPETYGNHTAQKSCPSGYNGFIERLCTSQGIWNEPENKCTPITCSQETVGNYTWPDTYADTIASILCMKGFTGYLTRYCSIIGEWSQPESNCMPSKCPKEILEDIIWPETSGSITRILSCPHGYKGRLTRYCNADGIWDVPENYCVPSVCTKEIVDGYEWPETRVEKLVSFNCNGYLIAGAVTRFCNTNEKWDPQVYDCHQPCEANILDGYSYPKTLVNQTYSFSCPSRYIGSITRRCLSNSQWENPINSCKLGVCPAQDAYPETPSGQTSHVPCIAIFPNLGEVTRPCNDGYWDNEIGSCFFPYFVTYGGLILCIIIVVVLLVLCVAHK